MGRITVPNDLSPLPRVTGSYYTRVTKWGLVVQAWPKAQTGQPSPYQTYVRSQFATAGWYAANPTPRDYAGALIWSTNTQYVPRDILTMAAYGRLLTIYKPDGTTYGNVADVTPNPQLVLDLITTQVGSIVYRATEGWIWLPPASNGQILTMNGGLPTWQDNQGAAGTGTVNVQSFFVPGTFTGALGWQKPAGCKVVEVYVIGAGGGGGSGRRGPSTENSAGGGGGGGGGVTRTKFMPQTLPASVDILVGAGGNGGPARTSDNTSGQVGGTGGLSRFGDATLDPNMVLANGGSGGNGGATSVTTAVAGGAAQLAGGTGGSGNNVSTGGTGGSPPGPAGSGGGGGGGLAATTRPTRDGGRGGSLISTPGWAASGNAAISAAGGIGASLVDAAPGIQLGVELFVGTGGGGGYCNNVHAGGNGGDGAQAGGGGGGGGASLNGNNSGAGGAGGDGAVIVISY